MDRKNAKIECPRCKSEQYQKAGFNRSGNQRYRCKNCGRQFVRGFRPEPEPLQEIKKPSASEIKKMESALSLDSVADCPCFLCLETNRHCIECCEDLENFLLKMGR